MQTARKAFSGGEGSWRIRYRALATSTGDRDLARWSGTPTLQRSPTWC